MFTRNRKNHIFVFCLAFMIIFSGCKSDEQSVIITERANSLEEDFVADTEPLTEADETAENILVSVYVCGAVVNPGVYELEKTAIKEAALFAAGGYADGAATAYVNLAEPIEAGEKIYFPYESELTAEDFLEAVNYQETETDKININTASKEELMTLSGIGESKANDIINYREEHGGFNSIEEIMNINGIKEGVYNKIKDSIVVN